MGQDIRTNAVGGEDFRMKFHEDGAFFKEALPTASSTIYSDVKDLGETLGGVCIRAYADEAVTGGTGAIASFAILAGDDKEAAGTDSAKWAQVASVTGTGTAMFAAGADILAYTPAPGDGKKYYRAAITVNGTGFGGKITVYNDLVPGR